jgi:hypothetical protein
MLIATIGHDSKTSATDLPFYEQPVIMQMEAQFVNGRTHQPPEARAGCNVRTRGY